MSNELHYLFSELTETLMRGGLSEKEAEKLIVCFLDEATSAISVIEEHQATAPATSDDEMDLFHRIVEGLQRGGYPFGKAVSITAEYACVIECRCQNRLAKSMRSKVLHQSS